MFNILLLLLLGNSGKVALLLSDENQNGRPSIYLKFFTFQITCWRCSNAERQNGREEGGDGIEKTVGNITQNARSRGR